VVAWWQTDDFSRYALFAAVAYIRAAAVKSGVAVRQARRDLRTGARPTGTMRPVRDAAEAVI